MSIKAVNREQAVNFLNVTPGATALWELMNKGIESAAVAYNPKINTRHFIADKNPTTESAGFEKQLDITQYAYKGDAVFEYVDDLFFHEKTGGDAQTELLQVFYYRAEEDATAYPAKKSSCTIVQADHGGEGGDQLNIAYNVYLNADPVYGTATVVDGKAVFIADALGA